jgi:AcrR family transcriptional regulator
VERTRAAVVAAAADLLLAHGPDEITHAHVAQAAGVSRTTVYKHWPDRADLLRSSITALGKTIPDPADLTGDLRADLRTLLAGLAGDLNDEGHARLMTIMMERAHHDPTVAEVRDTMVTELHATFDQVLRTAVDRGEIRPDIDLERAVAALGGSLLFTRFLAVSPIDEQFLHDVIDDFVSCNRPRAAREPTATDTGTDTGHPV